MPGRIGHSFYLRICSDLLVSNDQREAGSRAFGGHDVLLPGGELSLHHGCAGCDGGQGGLCNCFDSFDYDGAAFCGYQHGVGGFCGLHYQNVPVPALGREKRAFTYVKALYSRVYKKHDGYGLHIFARNRERIYKNDR